MQRHWRTGMILRLLDARGMTCTEAKPALIAQIFIGLFEAPVAGVTYNRYHAEHCLRVLLSFLGLSASVPSVSD